MADSDHEDLIEDEPADFDEFEEDTPVIPELPIDALARRQKQTNRRLKQLHRKVSEFVEKGEREHEDFRRAHEQTSGQIQVFGKELVDLKVNTATMTGAFSHLVDEMRSIRRISEVHQKVTIETDGRRETLSLEDQADARKTKRGLWAKIAGLIIGGVGALFGVLGIAQC